MVKGLESFHMTSVPNAAKEINILREIQRWREENPRKTPTLIIDLPELIYTITSKYRSDTVYGGRNNKLLKIVENYLQKIREAGANLVFFQNSPKNFGGRIVHYTMYDSIFRQLDDNKCVDLASYKVNNCDCRTSLGLDFETIGMKYGDLHISYSEQYIEILNYVMAHDNVLAIFAKHSSFQMFDYYPTQYWFCGERSPRLEEFNVRYMNVHKLNEFLGLLQLQKALFGSILKTYYETNINANYDNEHIIEKSDQFFSRQPARQLNFSSGVNTRTYQKILLASEYVRNDFPEDVLSRQGPDFNRIVSDIFDDNVNERMAATLTKHYDNYRHVRPINDEPLGTQFEMYREKARTYPFVYNVFFNKVILFPPTCFIFIDQRDGKAESYTNLILPLVRKNMGIILQHCEGDAITCRVGTSRYHSQFFPNDQETAIYPEIEVPDLDRLIFNTNDDDAELTNIKWRLLLWTLSIDSDVVKINSLMEVQDKLKSVVLTLMFLRQENQITVKEADTILITELDYLNGRIGDNITYPSTQTGRTIRIAHLYLQVQIFIKQSLRICGLRKFVESSTFDGVYFHNLLERYENELRYTLGLKKIEMSIRRLYDVDTA